MQPRYDVIIIGGGPAGATAAFFLGEAGRKVLVIEKETMPRYKPCGGGISTLILDQFPFSFELVTQTRVNYITYAFHEKKITIPFTNSSLSMFMRSDLDSFLLSHAQVEIRQGTRIEAVKESDEKVTVETVEGERFESDYLIGADGANSVTARALGFRRQKIMAGGIEIEAQVPNETLNRYANHAVLIFGELGNGYAWILPKVDHLSVGIGGLHPQPGELHSALERVMRQCGIEIEGQRRHGHPIPLYSKRERVGTARCLLVGDAAGLVDPVTGEGIRFAIKSGRMAAEAILEGRPEQYSSRVDRAIGRSHRLGYALMNIFYQHPNFGFKVALRNPVLSNAGMEMLEDRIGYGKLLIKICRSIPRFLLTKKAVLER
jgi:geranylgeranyl reductase family protein